MQRDTSRDPLYLAEIVEAVRTVGRWLAEHGDRWEQDEILRNAVLRQLMVVGEAASSLSEDVRESLPQIPWQQIRGFRNHAVHAYFSLDWAIVWEIADSNLPGLEEHVMDVLRREHPDVSAVLDDAPYPEAETEAAPAE